MYHLRVADHQLEIVILINAGAQVLVIVLELLNRHDMVLLVSLPDLHEVREHLVSSLATTLEIWVEAHIVSDLNVLESDLATAILVKDTVGLVDHVETTVVELSTDGSEELIE